MNVKCLCAFLSYAYLNRIIAKGLILTLLIFIAIPFSSTDVVGVITVNVWIHHWNRPFNFQLLPTILYTLFCIIVGEENTSEAIDSAHGKRFASVEVVQSLFDLKPDEED